MKRGFRNGTKLAKKMEGVKEKRLIYFNTFNAYAGTSNKNDI